MTDTDIPAKSKLPNRLALLKALFAAVARYLKGDRCLKEDIIDEQVDEDEDEE